MMVFNILISVFI